MATDKILSEINNILKEIISKTESIEKDKERLSRLELDIIMADIRNLYEHYNKLSKYFNTSPAVRKEAEKQTNKREVKEKETPFIHNIKDKTPEIIEEVIEETKSPAQEVKTEKKPAAETKEPKGVSSDLFSIDESALIADKFKDDGKSINDKLGQNRSDNSIADRLKNTQTDDIKTLIGINEKFLFINELFDGNMTEYNECIAQLNGFSNKSEANTYINNLKSNKCWKENLDSLIKLQELIDARWYQG